MLKKSHIPFKKAADAPSKMSSVLLLVPNFICQNMTQSELQVSGH
jgi:hypothetical protein